MILMEKTNGDEESVIVTNMDSIDFGYLRLLMRQMKFTEKFARPSPSRVRGRAVDNNKVHASFVRARR